ncbi:MAG: hypothetical protein AB7P04_07575 [Bacteriovoracia bacterium]
MEKISRSPHFRIRLAGVCLAVALLPGCLKYALVAPKTSGVETPGEEGEAPVVLSLTVDPRYANAAKWNDYVRTANYVSACTGAEAPTRPSPCMHGGDKRKVVITGQTSCTGLTLTDSVGAFDWTCDESGGTATFYSTLKDSIRLADLIDISVPATPAWKTMSVSLVGPNGLTGASTATVWWTNTVTRIQTDVAVQDLNVASTIYVATGNITTYGLSLNADKAALVIPSSYTATFADTTTDNTNTVNGESGANWRSIVLAGAQNFLWIEGSFSGGVGATNLPDAGIFFFTVGFSSVRHAQVSRIRGKHGTTGSARTGLGITHRGTSICNVFDQISISNVAGGDSGAVMFSSASALGLHVTGGSHDVFRRFTINNIRGGSGLDMSTPNTSNYGTNGGAATGASIPATVSTMTLSEFVISNVSGGKGGFGSTSTSGSLANYGGNGGIATGLAFGASSHSVASGGTIVNVVGGSAGKGGNCVGCTNGNGGLGGYGGAGRGIYNNGSSSLNTVLQNLVVANVYSGDGGDGGDTDQMAGAGGDAGEAGLSTGFYINTTGTSEYSFAQIAVGQMASGGGGKEGNNTGGGSAGFPGVAYNPQNFSFNTSQNNRFTGNVLMDVVACDGTGQQGLDNTCSNTPATSDAVIDKSVFFGSAFVGYLNADDSVNTTDTAGVAASPAAVDWVRFANPMRNWMPSSVNKFDLSAAVHWDSGAGQIVDWSLLAVDTWLLRTAWNGPTGSRNGVFAADTACPVDANGDETLSHSSGETVLMNAVEIVGAVDVDGTWSGDHDGLCEAGEVCLYSPNFGAYQGHGSIGTCTFSDQGGLAGITLRGYASNGR